MTYFLLQHRQLKLITGDQPTFPAQLVARVQFGPEDAFGVEGHLPRTTAKRAMPARVIWNANEGVSCWEGELIDVLKTSLSIGGFHSEWTGNNLMFTVATSSLDEASTILLSASQILPAILSFRLRTFVWIKEFTIEIDKSKFRLETESLRYGITIATTEHNQEQINEALRDWLALKEHSLRIIMAMYYFRHAERLATIEPDRQSMTAEVLLNLTKALEIIFSSDRERLRLKAKEWGFDHDFIEQRIIPLFLIRNALDVAHVASAPLSREQHQSLLDFTSRAISHVHSLLSQVAQLTFHGQIQLDPVSDALDKEKAKLLEAISTYVTLP